MSRLDDIRSRIDARLASIGAPTLSSRAAAARSKDDKAVIQNSLDRESLGRLDKGEFHFCPVLEAPFPVIACLARVFLAGHPKHKVCEKCKFMDRYIPDLLGVINNGKE